MTTLRRWLLLAIVVLYGVSIPWYREGGTEAETWLGLPDWVAVAVACYLAIAVLNAIAWLGTEVLDDDEPGAGEGG
jgi:hypothetical protein